MQRDDSTDGATSDRDRQTQREGDLSPETGLHNYRGWLCKSEISRAGQQMENSQAGADTSAHNWNFFFLGKPQFFS